MGNSCTAVCQKVGDGNLDVLVDFTHPENAKFY